MSEDELLAHLAVVYVPIAILFILGLSVGLRGRRAGSTPQAVEAPPPPHVGDYRTSQRPQPSLPRKAPFRRALWALRSVSPWWILWMANACLFACGWGRILLHGTWAAW